MGHSIVWDSAFWCWDYCGADMHSGAYEDTRHNQIDLADNLKQYLIDAFTLYAASAVAANTVLRSIVGGVLPLAGLSMYEKLGFGWGNSLIAFISLVMIPIPFVFYRFGERIRKSTKVTF